MSSSVCAYAPLLSCARKLALAYLLTRTYSCARAVSLTVQLTPTLVRSADKYTCGHALSCTLPQELIVSDMEEYEAMAVRLATDPEAYAALRKRTEAARFNSALFDTQLWVQHLETSLEVIYEVRMCVCCESGWDVE